MFVAIALVAFSGAAFAETGKVEKDTAKKLGLDGCVSVGFAASDAVLANGGTVQQATAAAEAAYNQCKKLGLGLEPGPR